MGVLWPKSPHFSRLRAVLNKLCHSERAAEGCAEGRGGIFTAVHVRRAWSGCMLQKIFSLAQPEHNLLKRKVLLTYLTLRRS